VVLFIRVIVQKAVLTMVAVADLPALGPTGDKK